MPHTLANNSPTGLNKTRSMEWAFSCFLFAWGANMLRADAFFDLPAYTLMEQVMSESRWGTIACCVAMLRMVSLAINGWWKRTPLFRLIGSVAAGMCWLSIGFLMLAASYTVQAQLPAGFAWYAILFVFEGWCVAAAGYDIFRIGSLARRVPLRHVA